MDTVNALQIRQSFGKILRRLKKKDEPLLIEKGRAPVAVLLSLKAFKERFIDYREKEKRDEILKLARLSATRSPVDSLKVLREIRYGSNH
ncbi:MAG: type II toxin-antitoxin system Phd/YefM family antitoxin [Deltaproteobacteria bacterium]|nr:type II toxin-antitoxin system Phd/YefM family antitoxin [Deltaproteobacteria bacterium]